MVRGVRMILRGSRHVYRHPDMTNQQENQKKKKKQEIEIWHKWFIPGHNWQHC